MLAILATCYLAGQLLFTVPEGWTVTQVYRGGQRLWSDHLSLVYCPPDCEKEKGKAFLQMVRTIKPGETVQAPPGCELILSGMKEKQ